MIRIGEAALLLVFGSLLARLLLKRPVRDELRAHPWLLVLTAFVFTGAVTVALWAFLHSPLTRHTLLGAGALIALLTWVRARPSYGHRRGLPPGTLGFARSLDALADEAFYERAAAQWGPVFKMSQFFRPVACITDLAVGLELLDTQRDALVQTAWGFNALVPGGYVEFMNGDAHVRTRQLLNAGFTAEVLADVRPVIQASVNAQLLAMMGRNRTDGRVDPRPFLDRVALESVLRMVLGVNPGTARAAEMQSHLDVMSAPLDAGLPTPSRVHVAFGELTRQVRGLAREQAKGPATPRSVLGELVRADPARLDDPAFVGNLILLVSNGREILARFLVWLVKTAAEQPDWIAGFRARVLAAPAAEGRAAHLALPFVHEALRTQGSPYVYRVIARDIRVGPYRLPRGWLLRLCVREAHLSPHHFPDPHRFDPHRFAERGRETPGFCPLGHGSHSCLGDQLTLEVACTVASSLALGYDTRIADDGPSERGARHWYFWQPGGRLRIHLSPREAAPRSTVGGTGG